MSDPTVEVSENCRCGGAVTVKGPVGLDEAKDAVQDWRKVHVCLTERELAAKGSGPDKNGATSVMGFGAPSWPGGLRMGPGTDVSP